MSKPKFNVLVPTDVSIKKNIIRWLRENVNDIDQVLVIVQWKDSGSSCRSNMNNMEKLFAMEQHKLAILDPSKRMPEPERRK